MGFEVNLDLVPDDPSKVNLGTGPAARATRAQILQRDFGNAKQKLGNLAKSIEKAQAKRAEAIAAISAADEELATLGESYAEALRAAKVAAEALAS